jgi:hypothetical protein
MNTCALGSAANDRARRWTRTMGLAVAVMADRLGTGMPCMSEVPAKTLDAPVSNVFRASAMREKPCRSPAGIQRFSL